MTAPPIPTFVPQDAWYNLTSGDINPSIADTVPNIVYLRPESTPKGMVDGLVGSLDGGLIYLQGLATQLDGGQKYLMWVANSLRADDGVNVFCPFADVSTPGRWVNTGSSGVGPGAVQSVQIVAAGSSAVIASSSTVFNQVFVKNRVTNAPTSLSLPGSKSLGQQFTIKDSQGDADTYNIAVSAPSIDGEVSDTLNMSYQERTYVWNGAEWAIQ